MYQKMFSQLHPLLLCINLQSDATARGPGQRGLRGAAAVIKVDHWHVGIHFVVVVGLEEKKFQWIQISVGMFLKS